MALSHRERHRTERIGWLRATVLGANENDTDRFLIIKKEKKLTDYLAQIAQRGCQVAGYHNFCKLVQY